MDCTICKLNKASYEINDILKSKTYICQRCLDSFDMTGYLKLFAIPIQTFAMPVQTPLNTQYNTDITCENCGMTYFKFMKIRRVGCAKDYELFNLGPTLEGYHKANQHVGKVPGSNDCKAIVEYNKTIELLKNRMDEAVKSDRFEEAAKLRDEIKALSKKMEML